MGEATPADNDPLDYPSEEEEGGGVEGVGGWEADD